MGNLDVGAIDLNDAGVVRNLLGSLTELTNDRSLYYALRFKPQHYFEVAKGHLPDAGGWYVILDGKDPLYVGMTDDFDKRLNTNQGSLDNFAYAGKASYGVRNFVKKLNELGILNDLRVFVIPENKLSSHSLSSLDRKNIEKLISIYRARLSYI
jgi:hypothetical protein